ncbi:MAG: di-heme-cytochrome C peroxidase, partial [Gammaproteobacteria bacterium]
RFYFIDQGSRLIPYDIFLNLEQAESEELFRSNNNIEHLGFMPAKASRSNPDGLPIGFAKGDDYLAPTCAACHTQLIEYQGKSIHLDGGQGMGDLQLFLKELTAALDATLNNKEKLVRFEKAVLGDNGSKISKQALRKRLKEQYVIRKVYNHRNHTDVPYGYTRLDAFGAILNRGLHLTGVADNFNTPNAPTSYPYIWDTPQHDYVEWDGSQSNSYIGALARNIGEVIGVFGDVDTTPTKKLFFIDGGYESSIQAKNLREVEMLVSKLHSPLWPSFFPEIDQNKAQKGRALYEQHCLACHADIDRTDPKRKIHSQMSTLEYVQTDPLMARNALFLRGKTGILEGKPRFYAKGNILGEEEPALFIVNNFMAGILKNNPLQSYLSIRDAKKLGHGDEIHPMKYVDGEVIEMGQEVSEHALLAYKARPLNGVWSSAPFLHNGSVPNLYELLLPAEERSTVFYLGDWEFDPTHVGYVATSGKFKFDTKLLGNSNAGHEYGTGMDGKLRLSENETWELLEYLKTL